MISKSEQYLKHILDRVLTNELCEDNIRPDWLKNPATGQNLELDRFYPKLKIGIEFNGPQHRKLNDTAQWKRDKLKKSLCAKAGVIRLVFYSEELSEPIARKKIEQVFEMRRTWASGKSWTANTNQQP